MNPNELITRLRSGESPDFATILAVIDSHYEYTPCTFANGLGDRRFVNQAGENEGSCKIFAFARMHGFSEQETLTLFGEHYRHVLSHPQGNDHRNIRTFMKDGWAGIEFLGEPLRLRR